LETGTVAIDATLYSGTSLTKSRIRNPLAGIPHDTLFRQVQEFAAQKGLEEHLPLLRKGALVAQDPNNYEDITGEHALSPQEVDDLRNEVLHKWRHPKSLYITIVTCSIGAAVQGWDQTGSNGANLSFPKAFGIGSESVHDTLLVGLVNSGPYIGAAFLGCVCKFPGLCFLIGWLLTVGSSSGCLIH
jgi:hypothetical protein